jgi:hypothetical protein
MQLRQLVMSRSAKVAAETVELCRDDGIDADLRQLGRPVELAARYQDLALLVRG